MRYCLLCVPLSSNCIWILQSCHFLKFCKQNNILRDYRRVKYHAYQCFSLWIKSIIDSWNLFHRTLHYSHSKFKKLPPLYSNNSMVGGRTGWCLLLSPVKLCFKRHTLSVKSGVKFYATGAWGLENGKGQWLRGSVVFEGRSNVLKEM